MEEVGIVGVTERPKRNVRRARSQTPEPVGSKRRKILTNRRQPDAPALRCQGLTISEIDLLKFVWALQAKGYEKLDAVGVELGYERGAAAKILNGLAVRVRKQQVLKARDIFSVSLFPSYYDQIIQLMRDEHSKTAGSAAALTSNAWSQALELAGKYGRFPQPEACCGIDYRRICRYLASALRGVPPPTLDAESDKALKRAVRQMQDNAKVHAENRAAIANLMGGKLADWKAKVGEKNATFRPRLTDNEELKLVPGATEPDSQTDRETESGTGGEKENDVVCLNDDAGLDERIEFAIKNSPALNPLRIPEHFSF